MREYIISENELNDLKHAMNSGNKTMMQQIIQDIEFRGTSDFFDYSARLTYLVNTGMTVEEAEAIAMREEKESIQ